MLAHFPAAESSQGLYRVIKQDCQQAQARVPRSSVTQEFAQHFPECSTVPKTQDIKSMLSSCGVYVTALQLAILLL